VSDEDKVKGILSRVRARSWQGSDPPSRVARDRAAKENIGLGLDILRGDFGDPDDPYSYQRADAETLIARNKGIIKAYEAAGGDRAASQREVMFESEDDRLARIAAEQEAEIRKSIEKNQRRARRRR